MVGPRNPDASQLQELVWLLDEADSAVQAWWQSEQVQWPEILSKLVSRLRLCGLDLEADGIADEIKETPRIGRKGCRSRRELLQLRQQVVDRVQKRIIAIREVFVANPSKTSSKPEQKRKGGNKHVGRIELLIIESLIKHHSDSDNKIIDKPIVAKVLAAEVGISAAALTKTYWKRLIPPDGNYKQYCELCSDYPRLNKWLTVLAKRAKELKPLK